MNRLFRCFLLAAMFVIILPSAALQGQNNISVSPGFGAPEFINVGVRFHTGQTSFGLQLGALPQRNNTVISAGAGLAYHFAGQSQYTTVRPWYAKSYLVYVHDESPERIFKDMYIDTRVGRVFNLSPNSGIEADIGLAINIYNSFERTGSGFILDLDFPVIPTLGIRWFYRF